jgi:hypothetical protein
LCSFPSFLYVLFVQNIQDCQSDRVVITDEAAGEFIQALSVFFVLKLFRENSEYDFVYLCMIYNTIYGILPQYFQI